MNLFRYWYITFKLSHFENGCDVTTGSILHWAGMKRASFCQFVSMKTPSKCVKTRKEISPPFLVIKL